MGTTFASSWCARQAVRKLMIHLFLKNIPPVPLCGMNRTGRPKYDPSGSDPRRHGARRRAIHAFDFKNKGVDTGLRRHECVREDALSARCKSVPGLVAGPEIEGNCVAARRGGEQPEVNWQSVG
jgi:hypothetical protein